MGHIVELTDEHYQTLAQAAAAQGVTPDTLLAQMIAGLRNPLKKPRYYQTAAWLQHLGMSDEEIADITREAEADADADA